MSEPMEIEPRVVGYEDFITAMAQIMQSIKETGTVSGETSKEIMMLNKPIWAMRRTLTGIRTSLRMYNAHLFEAGRIMRDIGFIGRSVTRMWQAYSIAQIRVADAAREIQAAQSNVILAEQHLQSLARQGLQNTTEYRDAQMALVNAQQRQKAASDELARARQENIIGYIGMAFQLGDVASRLILLRYHTQVFTAALSTMKTTQDAQNIAQGLSTTLKLADVKASIAHAGAQVKETLALKATTASLWLKAKALAVVHSLTPKGWAILAVAGAVAAGTTAWIAYQQSMANAASTAKELEKTHVGSGVDAALKQTSETIRETERNWRNYTRTVGMAGKSVGAATGNLSIHFPDKIITGSGDAYDELITVLRRRGYI